MGFRSPAIAGQLVLGQAVLGNRAPVPVAVWTVRPLPLDWQVRPLPGG